LVHVPAVYALLSAFLPEAMIVGEVASILMCFVT
jgi:hypothetical protein